MKHGNYQLVETKAPEGYQLDASPISFTIEKAQASPLQITVSNKRLSLHQAGIINQLLLRIKKKNRKETSEELENGNPETHGKETSEELENGNPKTQTNKQQDDQNKGKNFQIQVTKRFYSNSRYLTSTSWFVKYFSYKTQKYY